MPFTTSQNQTLLSQKYVGQKVIDRMVEIGIDDFEKLAQMDAETICKLVAAHLGTTCWGNSPMARRAIENAIRAAQNSITGAIVKEPPD